jgi:adenylate cyclase
MTRYVPNHVVDRLLDEDSLPLKGASAQATILFADLENFTQLSAEMGAAETVAVLNEYFSVMTDAVYQYEGIVDKYIGDALMAVFGPPYPAPDDTIRACHSAIAMMRGVRKLNETRRSKGLTELELRIGMSAGEVVAGNVGSSRRMDYTVIGDSVNLASRLETANKEFGTHILLSEFARERIGSNFTLREVDCIPIRGFAEPITLFELLDYHDETSFSSMQECVEIFHHALELYRNEEWLEALKWFCRVLDANPGDALSQKYVDRCSEYWHSPPGEHAER